MRFAAFPDDAQAVDYVAPGVVRVLPPGSLAPESVPYAEQGYDQRNACMSGIHLAEVPMRVEDLTQGLHDVDGVYCTRPAHGPEGVHVCHLRDEHEPHGLLAIIVWGGE